MTINVPLLRKTLEHIEAHPEEWDQNVWRCETGMCFAGTTAQLSGGQWIYEPEHLFSDYLLAEEDDPSERIAEVPAVSARTRAQRLLGLNVSDAERLFAPENDLDDLRRIVGELIEQAES